MLLYSLIRMSRSEIVVEFGSGHSTLFILRALGDNLEDFIEERESLIKKSRDLGDLSLNSEGQIEQEFLEMAQTWYETGGKSVGKKPSYYLDNYSPHLYDFEELPKDHEYVKDLQSVVNKLGHENIFTSITNQKFTQKLLPEDRWIDLAWNDHYEYRDFFSEFWPKINPKGGLLVFHNTVSVKQNIEDIDWMKEQVLLSGANDLEVLNLEEPHKLHQNGCTILRKTAGCQSEIYLSDLGKIKRDIEQLLMD